MARFNPYEQYLNIDAETTDQVGLIILLYDAAIRYLREARGNFDRNEPATAGASLEKARATISELRATLNLEKGGEIATSLMKLYNFVNHEILLTNAMREPHRLDNVIKVLANIREGWLSIAKPNSQPQPRVATNFSV